MTREFLKAARRDLGMTQADLARLLGVSRNTVTRWEVGLHPIPPIAARFIKFFLAQWQLTEPKK